MRFISYWPLGLLILVPGVILLYILKQRSEDKDMSSLYLWRETYKNMEVSTPWEKLKHNLLMYLQIFAVAGLVLALAGPYIANRNEKTENLVLVFDNSGSMNTIYEKDTTRLEYAKKQAVNYVEDLSSKVEVTLISSNTNAQVLLSGGKNKEKIKETIQNLESTDIEGNLVPSINMIESMSQQWESYDAIFFTDSSIDLGKLKGEVMDVSSQGKNAGINYVKGEFDEKGNLSVVAKVTNYGTGEITSDVNLYVNDKMVQIGDVKNLPSGESTIVYFQNISPSKYGEADSYVLKAEINEKDMLVEDNLSYDVIRDKEKQNVLLITEQNVFLEKVLSTMENVELYKANSYEDAKEAKDFDLYIFDGMVPEEIPEGNVVFVNPTEVKEYGEWFTVTNAEKAGGLVQIKLQDFIDMVDEDFTFGINQYAEVKPGKNAKVFLKVEEEPIGFLKRGKTGVAVVLAFDLHSSDFALQTEFPILMYQVFGEMLNHHLLSDAVLTAGEQFEVNGSVYEKNKSGVYQIKGETTDGKKTEQLAVNFPCNQESNVLTKVEVTQKDNVEKSDKNILAKRTKNLKQPLIIGILLLMIVEWGVYVYQRRLPYKKKE